MNVNERALGVLSCKWGDDVIIGAPFVISQELIDSFGINIVVRGSVKDPYISTADPYEIPKKLNMYKEIESPLPQLTTTIIVERILENHAKFEARNKKKQAKEMKLLQQQQQQ